MISHCLALWYGHGDVSYIFLRGSLHLGNRGHLQSLGSLLLSREHICLLPAVSFLQLDVNCPSSLLSVCPLSQLF